MQATEWEKTALPEHFRERMQRLLREEYEAFVKSYENQRAQGLRFNTLKCSLTEAEICCAEKFGLRKILWCREGWYYDAESRPGRNPLHDAGMYYIQEPSAMAVTEVLDPQPGEKILDLCAAPGGKTTHIAERMDGRGILISNEIHPARAKILSQNVERMGAANVVVTNEEPAKLVPYFAEYFDRIVVDAPCSGEGMFRKDEQARTQWSEDNVRLCAARQRDILEEAAAMIRPGGCIVYSTCTFSPEENEGTIELFLRNHSEFELEEPHIWPGFSGGRPEWVDGKRAELSKAVRIWPHKVEGEGHFLARLRKNDAGAKQERRTKEPRFISDRKVKDSVAELLGNLLDRQSDIERLTKRMVAFGDQIYHLPEDMPEYAGLRILRAGLHLGTCKKNRIEPAHALALALRPKQVSRVYTMEPGENDAKRYLAGETITAGADDGWVLMCVANCSVGWAKASGGVLKNHYPKGLRRQ